MEKLFVFQDDGPEIYRKELAAAFTKTKKVLPEARRGELILSELLNGKVKVVVSNGLSQEWYLVLKGLNIVTITFGDLQSYLDYSDIVIDSVHEDHKRYFTGNEYSIIKNGNFEIWEVISLVTKLEWDSAFFGFNIACLSCKHLTDNIARQVESFIHENKITLVEYLCNCHDRRSVKIAEKYGYSFVDIRLTFILELKNIMPVEWPAEIVFKRASLEDIPQLRMISGNIYQDSRYYFDGNFDRSKVEDFYKGWVEKGVRGEYDDECWCLYDEGIPFAFCTIRYHLDNSASIGLVGINHKYHGQGFGKKLLFSVFERLHEKKIGKVFVVTQGRNYSAQNLYQSVGFRTKASQLWYHKWM